MYSTFAVSVLATIASASFADFGTDLLEFDPPIFNLTDNLIRNTFKCRLKHKPEKPVNVYFEGPGVSFEGCSLQFDQNNHDTFQEVVHAGVSVFDKRQELEALVRARVFHGEERFDHEFKGRRHFFQGGICHALGDGHFKTFDDLLITHNQFGQFHLFDHPDFSIQAIRAPCFRQGGACHQAVSVRYGESILALDLRDEIFEVQDAFRGRGDEIQQVRENNRNNNNRRKNQRTNANKFKRVQKQFGKLFGRQKKRQNNRNFEMRQITPNRHGIIYTRPSIKNAFHHLRFPCGSEIKFHVVQDKFDAWINTVIHIAPGYNQLGGLCNRIRERGQLNHRDGSRSSRDDFGRFIRSWIVREEESIFHRNFKPSVPRTINHGRICRVPERHVQEDRRPFEPVVLPSYTALPFSIAATPTANDLVLTTTTIGAPTTTSQITTTATVVVETSALAVGAVQTTTTSFTTPNEAAQTTTTGSIVGTVAPTPTANIVEVLPTPPANQEFEARAQQHCTQLFEVTGCKETSNVDIFIKICIDECKASGNFAKTESIRLSFMAQCHTTTNFMIHDCQPQVVQQAAQTQQNVGFNALTCPNNCSGHGECGINGCRCVGGFAGLDCSIDEKALPAFNPETKQYQPASPAEIFPQEPALPPVQAPVVKYQPQLEVPFDVSASVTNVTATAPQVFETPVPTGFVNATAFDTVFAGSMGTHVSILSGVAALIVALA